jgi:hypothetical protein
MQDFTCALATFDACAMPCSPPTGRMRSGALPSCESMCAPMRASGSMTRRIGRRDSDASPISVDGNFCAASRPDIRRIEVPEFPRSRSCEGADSPCRPTPSTRKLVSLTRSIDTPMDWNAFIVHRQSSPSRKPVTSVRPVASDPSITERCEIDLSPGTRTWPVGLPPGETVQSRRSEAGVTAFHPCSSSAGAAAPERNAYAAGC